jgi:hypothetical protein
MREAASPKVPRPGGGMAAPDGEPDPAEIMVNKISTMLARVNPELLLIAVNYKKCYNK